MKQTIFYILLLLLILVIFLFWIPSNETDNNIIEGAKGKKNIGKSFKKAFSKKSFQKLGNSLRKGFQKIGNFFKKSFTYEKCSYLKILSIIKLLFSYKNSHSGIK